MFGLIFDISIQVMKKNLLLLVILFISLPVFSQKIDSIFFHLYTDSLKRGQHNYINVDGKLSNGRWLPLTSKEIQFSSSAGSFEGNDLLVPQEPQVEKVMVRAVLKSDPLIWKEISIWIKKIPDPEHLPSLDQINNTSPPKKKRH
jgi:hypothetical protein